MGWGTYVVEWLHILFAIFWFGSAMYAAVVLGPSLRRAGPEVAARVFAAMAPAAMPVFLVAGTGTVALGILRGTVFGRIKSVHVLLGTRYGVVWLIALGLALGLLAWMLLVVMPSGRRLSSGGPGRGEQGHPPGAGAPERPSGPPEARRMAMMLGVELVGFLLIFTCMVILNFS